MDHQQTYPANAPSDYMHTLQRDPIDVNIFKDISPTEWGFSPSFWQLPLSPYDESPISSLPSPGVHRDNTWNPFEQSFEHSFTPMQAEGRESFVTHNPSDAFIFSLWKEPIQCSPSDRQDEGESIMTESPSAMSEITSQEYEDGHGDYMTPKPEHFHDGPDIKCESPSTSTRQPAWESSRRTSTSGKSTNGPKHKRGKSCSTTNPTPKNNLRRSTIDNAAPEALSRKNSSTSSRINHNQVEKQYRNRLNGQFETLLETLPQDSDGEIGKGGGKRVGKAEILVLAKRYIVKLEKEKRQLELINGELEMRVEELRRRWVRMGG